MQCQKASNKSAGIDGLPIEFYKCFWGIIGADYVDVINECFNQQELTESQKIAVISTLFKKGNQLSLTNWHPISLLNCDYKIISKILCIRLGKVLDQIISSDQICGVPGRSISHNLLLLKDLIAYYNKWPPAVIIGTDQMKAFDRVDWDLLFHTLRKYNFLVPSSFHGLKSCTLMYGAALKSTTLFPILFTWRKVCVRDAPCHHSCTY